jgi:crotonobetainyl-CoA:carnitine CoA-transferase CaiB-like acyl-CoA transferase
MGDQVTDDPPAEGALSGVRVVDLTRARSGPTCVRQLADLGADVVQVAQPGSGSLAGSDSANLHRNKRSIVVDLRRDDGVEVLLRLVDRSDVLVENMRPAVKHRLGIGPEALLARNPRLVYASLSGFGQTGPYADRPGVDQIAQGMGGLMSVTGPPGSGPWRTGIAISDTASGTFLTQGILAALIARYRTGRGQWLHTSLLESMINFMDFQACRWLTDGVVPPQQGNDHPTFFPMGMYRSLDGYVNIAGIKSIEAFLEILGGEDLLADERFATAEARQSNRLAFNEQCEQRLRARPTAYWVERFNAAGIPAGPVYALDEVFADPQVRHLGLSEPVESQAGATAQVLRFPVTLTGTPASVRSGPPRVGAHTRDVLLELGYDDASIRALIEAGAVATSVDGAAWLR